MRDLFNHREDQKPLEHVRVVKAVGNPPAVLSVLNQPCIFQHAQMKGYLGLDYPEGFDNVTDAELSVLKQLEDAQPCFI